MLTTLLAGLASGETMLAVKRARRAAVAYFLAGLLGLAGLVFLTIAGYIFAARRYGAIEAALGFGGAFILIAILILVVHNVLAKGRARRASRRRGADLKAVGVAAAIAAIPTLLRNRTVATGALLLPAIAIAAYAIYRENAGPPRPGPDEFED